MELTYAELSSPGPARETNEDFLGFWEPLSIDEKRSRGAAAVLADGVGGLHHGEVASRTAVETALKTFRNAQDGKTPQQLIVHMFNAANIAVYDRGQEKSRMATTLAAVVFRNDEIAVGNVGDSRVYLVRKTEIKQLSTDHTYVGMQQKFGLISEQEAKTSENRGILTRSVGQEPVIRTEVDNIKVFKGDKIVICSDGLYAFVADSEIAEIVSRLSPAQACRKLVALAEQRGTMDNVSVQVIQVNEAEKVEYYKGIAVYQEQEDPSYRYELRPGVVLDERFLITETISRSGMATIFKATDQKTKETVALKVPFMEFESDPGFFARFQREEEIGLTLDHPYILKFIRVEGKSRPYIVTEYLRGYTLAHLLNSARPIPEKDALKLAARISEALTYLHEYNIVHRDLKPQNIMICYDGTIRIMDFGIARAETGRRLTFTGFTPTVGTPDYMAPEQVKGKRGDARTDIYSLGAILYEMVVGVRPFEGEGDNLFVVMNARATGDPAAPRKQNPNVSPQVEEIILHAMERNPEKRYQSAAVMKAELDNPGSVQLTGRCDRLKAPATEQKTWKKVVKIALISAIPVIILLLLILLIIHRGTAH